MRGDTTDFGPIPGAAEEGPGRSRIGIARFPMWRRGRVGLLLLVLIVLPWLPISGPSRDVTPAKRVRGVGDTAVVAFAFAPDGSTIATIQADGRVALRGAAGGGAHSFLTHRGPALAMVFAPDGRSLAAGGIEPDVLLHDLGADAAVHPLGMPIRSVKGLAFAPDGRTLAASSSVDHEILLWDLSKGQERARLRGHGSPVLSLAFAPDGRSLASGAKSDRSIVLWDLETRRPRRRLDVPPGPMLCLAFSPDGRWLASTGDHGRHGRLWDLDGRHGDRLIGGLWCGARNPLAFSPDGRILAIAGADGAVRLWDLATGTELHRVGGSDDRLSGVAFSPDGRMLAASGTDADIRLWVLADLLGAEIPTGPRATD
jgi:WD40 repeat protein